MRLSSIALEHLKRGKARAALVVAGLALGVATAVALADVTTALERRLGEELDRHGANIVVAPRTEGVEVAYGGLTVSGVSYDLQRLSVDDLSAIRSIDYAERLAVVAPALIGAVDADGKRAALAGVDFAETPRLKSWWQVSGRLPSEPGEVLVGHDAAVALGLLSEGDGASAPRAGAGPDPHASHQSAPPATALDQVVGRTIRLGGREHVVAGALAPTGSTDDRLVFMDLARAQELLGRPGEVSLVEVSALCVECPVEMMVAQIASVLPNARVSAVQQAVAARSMAIGRLARFGAALAAVVLVVAGLLVFVTVTGSVAERRREIGVLRAVGFRRAHILKIFALETALLGAAGGVAGWALGTIAAGVAARYFTEGAVTSVEVDPAAAAISVAAAMLIGVLGALQPALKASKLDPTEALRHV